MWSAGTAVRSRRPLSYFNLVFSLTSHEYACAYVVLVASRDRWTRLA